MEKAHIATGKKAQLVGDDIFVTNPQIFEKGIKEGSPIPS